MLAGLIWRGVAFEFRFKADEAYRPFWDKAFAWGSYIATFSQGVAVVAFINGFKVTGASYDGGSFDWLMSCQSQPCFNLRPRSLFRLVCFFPAEEQSASC
jgi:cytochrome bd-type quinol oxidase subunit 2